MKIKETKEKILSNSLKKFQKQYPNTTSGNLQTFILGFNIGFDEALLTIENISEIVDKLVEINKQQKTHTQFIASNYCNYCSRMKRDCVCSQ